MAFPVTLRCAPLLDLRKSRSWGHQLPAELATLFLWGLGAKTLLGAAAVPALAPLLGLVLLCRSSNGLGRRRSSLTTAAMAAMPLAQPFRRSESPCFVADDRSRRQLAEYFGLAEVQLFRGQHASICTLHHDADGRINDLVYLQRPQLAPLRDRHAHSVG
ncbi:MAG: hypothetical protein EBR68_02040 [Synechococcaceae bacterium WB4_2_0811]|nr:hypothetical protein [Synechococcaceae bacterium WB4_2_0811]